MSNPAPVAVRPISATDMDFLRHLYATTRADEMAHTQWDETTIAHFLAQQFDTQHRYYQAHYPDAQFLLIENGDRPIGRLYLSWGPSNLQIIDIALLPEHRGLGIGSHLLHELIERADALGLSIGLYVETYNPALRLYRHLGFHRVGENGVYLALRRPPRGEAAAPGADAHLQALP
ncbi:GNAT family N-acetyltransferase [Pseudomonas daroniae]|uniref:GNAT family N-acetyltransferase n=1 Tax=Phytopseudomonas daroniae TaxID=2487519 RepID=A0A4Q9QKY1_9GAMM|nr:MULTISPECIES: GNAT family N-acetyltransferase [Pseudomonas]TBU72811.1 GNAT family N-acetyltransferase [Pseudomonas daroniae]TBU79407.1 GNAT family N-acetyltransferase [Pseudomonas daroniae]TBU79491.1 GNAT family N-acetyltransferase [Pseudomonas sp. FRB 228]TBU91507.1 GNAT family N-acetyltransferase [Pseudomonas daroniae]